ncbi:MAG: glycosyltransferase [Deltaproteobacteria bacterium]|nr:glycosyltransferase [Deltaproteobacteria bacterium]
MSERTGVPRRILFSYENLLPTTEADAESIFNTAAALARRGHDAIVSVPAPPNLGPGFERDVLDYYGIDAPLRITPMPSFTKNIALQHVYHAMHFPEHPAFADADYINARNPIVVMRALQCGQRVLMDHYRPWGDQFPPLQPIFRRFMTHPRFLGLSVHSAYAYQSYRRLGVPEAKLRVIHSGFDPSRMDGPGRSAARSDVRPGRVDRARADRNRGRGQGQRTGGTLANRFIDLALSLRVRRSCDSPLVRPAPAIGQYRLAAQALPVPRSRASDLCGSHS